MSVKKLRGRQRGHMRHGSGRKTVGNSRNMNRSQERALSIKGGNRSTSQPKAEARLIRTPFVMSREAEFFSEKELEMQIGHPKPLWLVAIARQLIDNALDACEITNRPPIVSVRRTDKYLEVKDNGPGISSQTIKESLNYLVRVSDKNFYVSPTRGQLGNALKTVWAVPYVLFGKGTITVEAHGKEHLIEVTADALRKKPRIAHSVQKGIVRNGTLIRIEWPNSSSTIQDQKNANSYKALSLEGLVQCYRIFNPHATFEVNGKTFPAEDHHWRKWRPDNPTSVHWYSLDSFRDLIGAYISNEAGNGGKPKTVREFFSEFRGLSSTVKQKGVTGREFSSLFLHDLVKRGDLDVPAVNKLLDRMKNSSRPVSPRALGLVGEEHFKKQLQRLGVTPDSFKYTRICAVGPDQLPYCIEAAFGIKNDPKLPRTRIMGLNWSPSFGVPIPEIEEAIQTMRIDKHDPVVLVVHLSTPKLHFVSRGKARAEL